MGLNLSNRQIATELDLNEDDGQVMASRLREGVMAKKKQVKSNVMRYTLSPDIKVVPMWWRSWVGWGDADGSKVLLGVARWPVKSRLSWA